MSLMITGFIKITVRIYFKQGFPIQVLLLNQEFCKYNESLNYITVIDKTVFFLFLLSSRQSYNYKQTQ